LKFNKRSQYFIRTHNVNAFRRRDVRRQSRLFDVRYPGPRPSPLLPKAPLSSIESNRLFRNKFATDFMLNGMTTGV